MSIKSLKNTEVLSKLSGLISGKHKFVHKMSHYSK